MLDPTKLKFYIPFLFLLLYTLIPTISLASPEVLSNTGLVPSNIWYSKDPFYAGDKVRIYTVIFNGSAKDIRGRANFYNNNSLICNSDFASLAGRVSEVWCDWTAILGKNGISIKITNTRGSAPGEDEQDVLLSNTNLSVSERFVKEAPKLVQLEPIASTADSAVSGDSTILNQTKNVISKIVNFANSRIGNVTKNSAVTEKSVQDKNTKTNIGSKNDISQKQSQTQTTSNAISGLGSIPSNIAAIFPALSAIKDKFYALTASLANWILPKIKSWSETDNKPLATVLGFVYTLVKFIFDSPAIFASILIAVIWKIFEKIFRSGENY